MRLGAVAVLAGCLLWLQAGPREVALRGHVECIGPDRQSVPCRSDSRDFAFRTESGERYFFLADDDRTRMFHDPRVREKLLEIRAWDRGGGNLELVRVYSIKDGKLFDLHYYCSVCSIRSYAGGPCWCCQQEFELRETPLP
ncbi:MAG: hypothetical protein Kow001_17020 [Acidobacteriota bacterium]